MKVRLVQEIYLPKYTNESASSSSCVIEKEEDFDCNGIRCCDCIFSKKNYDAMYNSQE